MPETEREALLKQIATSNRLQEDLAGEIRVYVTALERLRDCDWTIGRGDRMDAVREVARTALETARGK